MAEIDYREEYGKYSLSIESTVPQATEGELSLMVVSRSSWGGDHIVQQSAVLLDIDDMIAMKECLEVAIQDAKRRNINKPVSVDSPKKSVQPKKFTPRKRSKTSTER